MHFVVPLICTALLCLALVNAATYSDATMLHTTLISSYNKHVRPKANQDERTDISILMELKSITSLDEIKGILTTVSATNIYWIDDNLQWIPSHHGNITKIKIEESLIWIPEFITANPAKKVEKLGLPSLETTVYFSGIVLYTFGEMLRTTCDPDVTYFPFDTQHCVIELTPYNYDNSSVNLISEPVRLDIFSENNVWILKSTSSETAYFGPNPYAKITLTLERRYAFFILNLFSPVAIVAVLNALVFVLPAESGERVGYAITCQLSLSVYMTFASENLPTSSKPIAVLIYVLLMYMFISTLICLGTIIGLKLNRYGNKAAHPFLVKMCSVSCRKTKIEQSSDSDKFEISSMERKQVTWTDIAHIFDKVCFLASIICILLISVIYVVVVKVQ